MKIPLQLMEAGLMKEVFIN